MQKITDTRFTGLLADGFVVERDDSMCI